MEAQVVNRSPYPPPEKVFETWAREWFKEWREVDLSNLPTKHPAFENLPRRWVTERSAVTRVAPSDGHARYVAATASTSMSIPATARAETSTAVEAGAGPSGR